jgi:arylsulfatase A-like enzyme/tetratricopeptide (TPR) repeat protein
MAIMRPRSLLPVAFALLALACNRPPANVLLVTFDTTRWDHVGYASGRQGLTPNLDALAERGTWFSSAIASAPITLPSHATILTGTEPYRHGVRNNGTYVLTDNATTLAECLADRGYRTHAIVSAFVLDGRFGLDQGFSSYDDDLSEAAKESVFMSREIPAERTADKAVSWLRDSRDMAEPFLLWVHFFDPHAAYVAPPDTLARFPGEPYAAEIAYADAMLGRIIAELEHQGMVDSTLIVFLSDHGESLGEHGESTHGIFVYDATMRVPLLMAGPGVASGRRVSPPVRTVDVMPTILDLVGAPIPVDINGASLRPVMAGDADTPVAYVESFMPRLNYGWSELRGLRSATHKVVRAPRPEAFDLIRDPDETTNLFDSIGDPPADVRALLEELDSLETEDPFFVGAHGEAVIDESTRQALEALGYSRAEPVPGTPEAADPKDRISEFETLRTARGLIDEQRLVDARAVLIELVERSPRNLDATLALAHVHEELDDPEQALAAYGHALSINPSHRHAVAATARLLAAGGRIESAETLLTESLAASPDSLELHTELGRLYEKDGEPDRAEASFSRALEIDPTAAEAALGLARCLERRAETALAFEVIARAYDYNRNNPEIVERLALLYQLRGDHETSIGLFGRLTVLEPGNPSAWNNLAAQLARARRYPEAAEAAQRAYSLEPDRLEIRANLGTMLALAGELERGLHHLDAVIPRMPDNTYGATVRAEALEHLGLNDRALAAWRDLATRDPAAGVRVARLELELGNEPVAREALVDAVDRGGEPVRSIAGGYPELHELLSQIP